MERLVCYESIMSHPASLISEKVTKSRARHVRNVLSPAVRLRQFRCSGKLTKSCNGESRSD